MRRRVGSWDILFGEQLIDQRLQFCLNYCVLCVPRPLRGHSFGAIRLHIPHALKTALRPLIKNIGRSLIRYGRELRAGTIDSDFWRATTFLAYQRYCRDLWWENTSEGEETPLSLSCQRRSISGVLPTVQLGSGTRISMSASHLTVDTSVLLRFWALLRGLGSLMERISTSVKESWRLGHMREQLMDLQFPQANRLSYIIEAGVALTILGWSARELRPVSTTPPPKT